MNKLRSLLLSAIFVLSAVAVPVLVPASAYADTRSELCKGTGGSWNGSTCTNTNATTTDLNVVIKNVVNVLLFVVGAASVIMIIVGGLRYVTSGGDSGSVNGAKNTILYAVVGIVVAFMAYGIVNFVVTKL
jgi:hypothetical protein